MQVEAQSSGRKMCEAESDTVDHTAQGHRCRLDVNASRPSCTTTTTEAAPHA
jgi:hypothetical protein